MVTALRFDILYYWIMLPGSRWSFLTNIKLVSWLSLSVARTRGCLWESSVACLIRYCFSCRGDQTLTVAALSITTATVRKCVAFLKLARLLVIILAYALNFVSAIECSNWDCKLAFRWSCKWLNKVGRGIALVVILHICQHFFMWLINGVVFVANNLCFKQMEWLTIPFIMLVAINCFV